MSCISPSNNSTSRRLDVTSCDFKPSVRSAYMQSFTLDNKTSLNKTTKWDRIIQNFLSTSTLHGVSHLRPPCSKAQKIFWLLAILSCGTFFFAHATVLVYNALTRPALSTTLTLKYRDLDGPLLNKHERITKFPGITICGLQPFRRHDTEDSLSLTMYHALSLGYPYTGLTLGERIHLHQILTNKSEDGNNNIKSTLEIFKEKLQSFTHSNIPADNVYKILLKHSYRCEEVFSRCTVGFETLNCCAVFLPILTTFGYCFALQINKTSLGTLEMETLPFIIDLHVPTSNTTDSEEGYLLLVHDPRFTPRMILPKDGFLVAPGVTMSLRLTLRITDYSAKYTKWFGLVTDCPKVACMGEDYSIQECIFQNAAHKIRDICHCSWILDECKNGEDIPICGPKEMTECVIIKSSKVLNDLLKKCQPPCLEYIFEAASSYAQLRYNYSLQERSRITISYNTISYYHNIYHKHYLSSLFSDIGGSMGLLLGASCLTGVELLTFLGQWIYFTFFQKL
ncbi:acid-sensing ion channel 4-B-like [Argiope bruennichi]|nr:acid-sensing ion channel 4-B-like [Argiope bruennichi]